MRQSSYLCALGLCTLLACAGSGPEPASPGAATEPAPASDAPAPEAAGHGLQYPPAPRHDTVDQLHGVPVADPYRWLEDPAHAGVGAWVDAQDRLARATLARQPRRDALAERFRELYYLETVSTPHQRAGRYFYTRRQPDEEKSILYWKEGKDGAEQVLVDPNVLSQGKNVTLRGWSVSWDGKKLAYKLSENNADEATLHVRSIDTGEDSKIDVIPGAKYADASWTPDNAGFYYTWLPADPGIPVADRPGQTELRYHALGTDPAQDPLVFPATRDPRTFLHGDITRDGRWLVLVIQHGWHRTDVYVKDMQRKQRAPRNPPGDAADMTTAERVAFHATQRGFVPLAVGKDAVFRVDWWQGRFFVHTNHEASNYRVLTVAAGRGPRHLDMARWREIVPESDATLSNVQIIGNHLVLSYVRNAASEVEIRDLDGKLVRKLALPGIGSTRGLAGNPGKDEAYFAFSSFTTPDQIYETSIRDGQTSLWAELDVPVDTSDMVVEQVWYPSKDGTRVSMFLVHRKDMVRDGKNPVLLYGYGGFDISLMPSFSALAAVWLEQGGIYAVANLRGGGEYGEDWHRAGMLLDKQNVFDDFIAAAEHLIGEGYTNPDELAIYGRSNGGLLVGAAMTQRPDLYRAVVCGVPLLDMVRYHLFGSGKTWIPEYGSADDPAQFQALHAYSPYHRVEQGTAYPALLMLAADGDDRVDPLHARKFTAAVQWATASEDRPVIMRVERGAGHGGADRVAQTVEQYADLVAFLLWQLRM